VEAVVDRQIAAYNSGDLEAFAACYADDVVVEGGGGNVLMQGIQALRGEYGPFFRDNPNLHGEITNRIRIGAFVIDEERITGWQPEPVRAVVIYHLSGDLIDHVRLLE
jgi:uncharacterized protein (TIGR02246 family)